jgi:endonuclease-3
MTDSLFPDAHIPPPPSPPVDPDRLPHIHRLLLGYYGEPPVRERWDPLTQFIYSVLAARTRTEITYAALARLRTRFGTWENLREASVDTIQETIADVTYPEQKAPNLKLALQQITTRTGELSLDFLGKYRTEKIRSWIEQFPGAGPMVSAEVVNFSTLRRPALVMNSHHLRIVHRLGLTPRADAQRTEELLMRLVPETWTPEILQQDHALFKLHGQTLCTFTDPLCPKCPLLKLCRYGQRHVNGEPTQAPSR